MRLALSKAGDRRVGVERMLGARWPPGRCGLKTGWIRSHESEDWWTRGSRDTVGS